MGYKLHSFNLEDNRDKCFKCLPKLVFLPLSICNTSWHNINSKPKNVNYVIWENELKQNSISKKLYLLVSIVEGMAHKLCNSFKLHPILSNVTYIYIYTCEYTYKLTLIYIHNRLYFNTLPVRFTMLYPQRCRRLEWSHHEMISRPDLIRVVMYSLAQEMGGNVYYWCF